MSIRKHLSQRVSSHLLHSFWLLAAAEMFEFLMSSFSSPANSSAVPHTSIEQQLFLHILKFNWIFFSFFLRRSHSNKSKSCGRGALWGAWQWILLEAFAKTECFGCHVESVVEEWLEGIPRYSSFSWQVHCCSNDTTSVDKSQLWPIFYKTNCTCEIYCTGYVLLLLCLVRERPESA